MPTGKIMCSSLRVQGPPEVYLPQTKPHDPAMHDEGEGEAGGGGLWRYDDLQEYPGCIYKSGTC